MNILHLRNSDNKHENNNLKIYGIMNIIHLRTSDNKSESNGRKNNWNIENIQYQSC